MPAYTYSGRPSYTGSTHVVHGESIVPVLLAFVAAASRVQAKAQAYVSSQNHRALRCILNTSTQAHDLYTCTIVRTSAASACKDTESQGCENARAEMHEPETCRARNRAFPRHASKSPAFFVLAQIDGKIVPFWFLV
jgi:hypothetical protein